MFAKNDPCKQKETHKLSQLMDNRPDNLKWLTEHSDQYQVLGHPNNTPKYKRQISPLAKKKHRQESYQVNDPCK